MYSCSCTSFLWIFIGWRERAFLVMDRLSQLIERLQDDYAFRTFLGAGGSFLFTLIFAIYNAYLGLYLHSVWNGSISIYYILLSIIRGMIIYTADRVHKKNPAEEKRIVRRVFMFSSATLVIINLVLFYPVALMVLLQRPAIFGLIPCILLATYTVYKLTMASINFRKKDKISNLFVRELRTINLMDAILSIITLQNALISYKGSSNNVFLVSAISSAFFLLQMIFISIRNFHTGLKEL